MDDDELGLEAEYDVAEALAQLDALRSAQPAHITASNRRFMRHAPLERAGVEPGRDAAADARRRGRAAHEHPRRV